MAEDDDQTRAQQLLEVAFETLARFESDITAEVFCRENGNPVRLKPGLTIIPEQEMARSWAWKIIAEYLTEEAFRLYKINREVDDGRIAGNPDS